MSRIVVAIGALGALGTALALASGLAVVRGNEGLGGHAAAALLGLLASLFCHVWLGVFFAGSLLVARRSSGTAEPSLRTLALAIVAQTTVVVAVSFAAFWSGYAAYTRDVTAAAHSTLGGVALLLQGLALAVAWQVSGALERQLGGR